MRNAVVRQVIRLAVTAAFALPAGLEAQVISGLVRSTSASPMKGTLVLGVDSVGKARSSAISGGDGSFRLNLPSGGSWTVRVERLGTGTADTTVIVEDDESVEVFVELRIVPVAHRGIGVDVGSRCPLALAARPEDRTRRQLQTAHRLNPSDTLLPVHVDCG